MPEMLMSGIPFSVVKAIEARVSGGQSPSDLTREQMELSKTMDWRPWCAAWRLARLNHLVNEAKRYPDPHRVLPTKLGNLMRSTEDELQHEAYSIESLKKYRPMTALNDVR